jgi:uncharacterized protein (TIGR02246 family)
MVGEGAAENRNVSTFCCRIGREEKLWVLGMMFGMHTLRHLALAIGTVIALSACAPAAPPPVDTAAEEAALKATTAAWLAAYNAGDVEKIVAMYAEDAVLMPPHAGVANGHAGIRAFLTTDTAAAKAAGVKIVPGAATAGIAGDTGWESGSYTIVDASGATVDSGSYLSVSRKSSGKWLLVRDTYNSDRPLPAPAPAAAEKKKT